MKRFYLSLSILVAVVLMAAWVHSSFESNTALLLVQIDNLSDFSQYAEEKDLIEHTEEFINKWKKSEKLFKIFSSNAHIETAQRSIDSLLIYTAESDRVEYTQACSDVKNSIAALRDNEILIKENILISSGFIHK